MGPINIGIMQITGLVIHMVHNPGVCAYILEIINVTIIIIIIGNNNMPN